MDKALLCMFANKARHSIHVHELHELTCENLKHEK